MSTDTTTSAGGLDLSLVGHRTEPFEARWDSRDAIIYALGVGASHADPAAELAFTTENTRGVEQQVLPTFAVTVGLGALPPMGDIKLSQILHAEQTVTLHQDLPVSGHTSAITTIAGMYDKGSGGLVQLDTEIYDAAGGEALATISMGLFVQGAGGWGGERGPKATWAAPERAPDEQRAYAVSESQALLYRLSGDVNPLHSDPKAAAAVGFPRPILHGLCTYGYTGRALLDVACVGDVSRFGSMRARFSLPVLPGQTLTVSVWNEDDGALFQTATDAGVVLDQGTFTTR